MYWDPTGHWKEVTGDGKTYAIAESGDTLSGLAKEELGNASKWKELGYTGNPTKLQIGAKIDITKFNCNNSSGSTSSVPAGGSANIHKDSNNSVVEIRPALEDLYKLDEEKMKNQAIQLSISGTNLNIKAYINFTGDANTVFGGTDKTYGELAVEGIKEYWKTDYSLEGSYYDFTEGVHVYVETEVIYKVPGQSYDNNSEQKYMNININNSKPIPIIGWIGDIYGIYDWNHRSHMETGNEGWSITDPGRITLYEGEHEVSHYPDPVQGYKNVVAHEFGHILGISDAYKRPGSKAAEENPEVPRNDIMRQNYGVINANTIEMVLEAWSTNQWQNFDGDYKQSKSKVLKFK